MSFRDFLKERRKICKLTQQQLADALNVSKQAVSKWENAKAFPDILSIPKLASALHVSPMTIVEAIWSENKEQE